MTMAVPGITPVTTPEVEPTEAVPASLLDQLPPADTSDRRICTPGQTKVAPEIAAGSGLITTVLVALLVQPKPLVTV